MTPPRLAPSGVSTQGCCWGPGAVLCGVSGDPGKARGSDSCAQASKPLRVATGSLGQCTPDLAQADLPSPRASLLRLTHARGMPCSWVWATPHPSWVDGNLESTGTPPTKGPLLTKFSLQTVQFHMLEFPVTTWVDLFHLRGKQNKTWRGFSFPRRGLANYGFSCVRSGHPGRFCSQRGSWQAGSEVEIA